MIYTPQQRENTSRSAEGKTIRSMEWDEEDSYWVIDFTDDTQMCVLLMAEVFNEPPYKAWQQMVKK